MPQVLPAHHFSLHIPKLTPAGISLLEFAVLAGC